MATFTKNFDFNLRRDLQKKIPMSVAPMSRLTKKVYLRLCSEKTTKKNEFGRIKVKDLPSVIGCETILSFIKLSLQNMPPLGVKDILLLLVRSQCIQFKYILKGTLFYYDNLYLINELYILFLHISVQGMRTFEYI